MKKINLEEILISKIGQRHVDTYNGMIVRGVKVYNMGDMLKEAMKEAIKQALELAAENATWSHTGVFIQNVEGNFYSGKGLFVRKDSILNTINQIE